MQLNIVANNYQEFISKINEIKIDIKRRRDGREQNELENWVIQKYLIKTLQNDGFFYKLSKRESPDFELQINGLIQGIEVTEPSCEQYQKLLTYIDKNPDLTFEMDEFRYGHEFSNVDLFKLAKVKGSKLSGPGWGGSQSEVFASKWALDAALKKIRKLEKWEYQNEIRLVLYDNTPTVCNNTIEFERIARSIFSQESELKKFKIDLLTSNGNKVISDLCKNQ